MMVRSIAIQFAGNGKVAVPMAIGQSGTQVRAEDDKKFYTLTRIFNANTIC